LAARREKDRVLSQPDPFSDGIGVGANGLVGPDRDPSTFDHLARPLEAHRVLS
jgi:hypothetical protein